MPSPEFEPLPAAVSLRACSDGDEEFLLALFMETSAALFSHLPLPPEQKRNLLEMQLRAREHGWRSQYQNASFQIVCVNGNPAGYFAHNHGEEKFQLIYLGLLRKYHAQGIAGALVRALQRKASSVKLPIAACVELGNPALAFWKHLDFEVLENTGVYDLIRWNPG